MRIILNETLKSKGKSQYWLAKETGISAAAINNLCNGKTTSIQVALVDKICLALDCNVSDIFLPDSSFENRMLHYKSAIKKNDS